jgi:valyl-tRNA synthetase
MEQKYNHEEAEQAARQLWQTNQTYSPKNNPGTTFSIDTPPPTVSGSLHIGHIFSYTQTDIIARYKRMSGYSVFYPFGFDDNGLPTEKFVEKMHNVRAHELPRSEFIELCLKATHDVEQEFKTLWQQIGLSVDWHYWYSTISESSRRLSQQSFIDLYNKGFIYRKDEPALYCTVCRTSVAQAELDDKEVPSFFNDIVFQDEQGNDLIIGTTRPELLASCVALLYNPADERYQHLKGQQATVPIFNFKVPIIADEQVQIDKGTGLVMCCTFGDKTDIEWFKKYNLPYKPSIDLGGVWMAHTGPMAGKKAHEARKIIIDLLKEKNLLLRQREIVHNVSVHERCKKEIEYVVQKQWFIAILAHKKELIQIADQINWYPAFMKARYTNWVENLNWDWCISRQRFFGIPFPAWHCTDCNEILLAKPEDAPIDPQETPYPYGTCTKCGGSNIVPDKDVMDTWNTSSITPYLCRELFTQKVDNPFAQKSIDFVPMSMRPQAHDIIRTWAFDTIVKTWMHHGIKPWNDIVISGHVLAGKGEKLSKSKENASLTPQNLLKEYPADVVRYWTASGSLGYDIAFSENQLKIGGKLSTKMWNAFRFVESHITSLENPEMEPRELGDLNKWLLHRASETFANYERYFAQNEFGLALTTAEQFFWQDFCDNYLELIKNQLFNPEQYDAQTVHATRWTLYQAGLRILQWFAPYLPHLTETLFQSLYARSARPRSIHQTHFASVQKAYDFHASAQLVNNIIEIVSAVRKLKSEHQLSLKVPIAVLTLHGCDAKEIKPHEQLIRGVTHAESIEYSAMPVNENQLVDDGGWHASVGSERKN